MTFFPEIYIRSSDSPSIDAFNRYRVANPITLFDSKQLFDEQALFWNNLYEVSATGSHSPTRASTTLTTTTSSGSLAIRQSKQRMNYQPGKSLQCITTFNMGEAVENIRTRIGIFDDDNGIYIERDGSNINLCIKNGVDGSISSVSQSQWNIDKFNGLGSSQVTLDLTKIQIMEIDYQWLGAGRVRCGFVHEGILYPAHQFTHANKIDSVYMSTPNLPIRYEIKNTNATSATGSLEHICSMVVASEGGHEQIGSIRSADRDTTKITVSEIDGLVPVISIRLKSGYKGANIIPSNLSIIAKSNADIKWSIVLNPTIGGTDNASWVSLPNSAVEYDISRTITNSLTNGIVLKSGYAKSGNFAAQAANVDLQSGVVIGENLSGGRDELVLAVQVIGASNEDIYGSISWRELF